MLANINIPMVMTIAIIIVLVCGIAYFAYDKYRQHEQTIQELKHLNDLKDHAIGSNLEIPIPDQKLTNRKYLNDLGTNGASLNGISPSDTRQAKWAEEQAVYGFDERDTWGLDATMIDLLYERVMYFVEFAPIDFTAHEITIYQETKTLDRWLADLTSLCEGYITDERLSETESNKYQYQIWTIWRDVSPYMWW